MLGLSAMKNAWPVCLNLLYKDVKLEEVNYCGNLYSKWQKK